jgi:anti-anti-sigma factor
MSKNIEVTTETRGEVAVIGIKGDVTAITGESIEAAYQQVSTDGVRKVLLRFSEDCYINSGGIAILIGIASESRKKEQTVRITGLSPHFEKIFDMMGLTKYTEIYPSVEAALEDF